MKDTGLMDTTEEWDRIDHVIASLSSTDGIQSDPSPMGVLIRIGRIHEIVEQRLEDVITSRYVRHKKDHDLLVTLLQTDKPLANKQLQRILHITSPSVSQRVGRLIKAGLIDKVPDPKDSRANHLTLTELGRRITIENVDRALQLQKAILESVFDPGEVEALADMLRSLTRSLGDAPAR